MDEQQDTSISAGSLADIRSRYRRGGQDGARGNNILRTEQTGHRTPSPPIEPVGSQSDGMHGQTNGHSNGYSNGHSTGQPTRSTSQASSRIVTPEPRVSEDLPTSQQELSAKLQSANERTNQAFSGMGAQFGRYTLSTNDYANHINVFDNGHHNGHNQGHDWQNGHSHDHKDTKNNTGNGSR